MLASLLLLVAIGGSPEWTRSPQPAAAASVEEVREQVSAARKAIEAYRAGGGKNGVPDHPAEKWSEALWSYRERTPGTPAAAMATAEAIQLLIRAELSDRAHARADTVASDDAAWERLASYLYSEGVSRNDYSYVTRKLAAVAEGTGAARVRAAALMSLGRAYRRQSDLPAAVKSVELARTIAQGTPAADEADGLLYDIRHLSVGLRAPDFSGAARDGRVVTLDGLRGQIVVLVFWGAT